MGKLKSLWEKIGGPVTTVFKLVFTLGAVFVLAGLAFGWFEDKPDVEEVDALKDLRGNVEVLYRYVDEVSGKPTVSYDLFLKDPFMDSDDFELVLMDLIEKDKEVVKEETDEDFWGAEFKIYTRMAVYEQSLNAPFTATYGHKDGYEQTTLKRLARYKNHEFVTDYYPLMYTYDSDGNEKKVMISDKDYELFLRFLMYQELGGNDYSSGMRILLNYELGYEIESPKYYEMYDKYEALFDQAYNVGEPRNMYLESRDYLYEYLKEFDKKLYDYLYKNYGDPNESY